MTPTLPRGGMGVFDHSVGYGWLSLFGKGQLQIITGHDQRKKLSIGGQTKRYFSENKKGRYRNDKKKGIDY